MNRAVVVQGYLVVRGVSRPEEPEEVDFIITFDDRNEVEMNPFESGY